MSAAVGLMPVAHSAEIVVVCAAVVGGCVGFLWFNAPPARVFMGDTGSLALGALLGTVSVMTRHEILLAVVGGVFVVEALSVMIQVAYFRKPAGVFSKWRLFIITSNSSAGKKPPLSSVSGLPRLFSAFSASRRSSFCRRIGA